MSNKVKQGSGRREGAVHSTGCIQDLENLENLENGEGNLENLEKLPFPAKKP